MIDNNQKTKNSSNFKKRQKGLSTADLQNVQVPDGYSEIFVNDLTEDQYKDMVLDSSSFVKKGDLVNGKVVECHGDTLLLDINYKNHVMVDLRELENTPLSEKEFNVGDIVEVYLTSLDEKNKHISGSIIEAHNKKHWSRLREIKEKDEVVYGKVISYVRGGLILDIGIKAFLPASLIEIYKINNFDKYIGEELGCKIIELDESFSNIILSRKAVLMEINQKNRENLKKEFKVGQIRVGTITSLVNFGAFVEFGGIDGLIHISEISWNHIKHPSEILSIGQEIEVEILSVNEDFSKVSLSHKSTHKDPWKELANQYDIGMFLEGSITNIFNFGFFVKLNDSIEGLVHISEILPTKIENTHDVVDFNQVYVLKILDIDLRNRKIALSLKGTLSALRENQDKTYEFNPELYSRYFEKDEEGNFINQIEQRDDEFVFTGDSEEEKQEFEKELTHAKKVFGHHVKQIKDFSLILKEIKK